MTVDPRIAECASALRAKLILHFPALEHQLSADVENDIALACVLKWLEQEPSPQMLVALNEIGTFEDRLKPDASDWYGDPDAYRAMCAQAAKEIGGV